MDITKNKALTGILIIVFIVGAGLFITNTNPFAAVPSSHDLGSFNINTQVTFDGTVHLDSSSKSMDLYYKYVVFGPDASHVCYDNSIWESDWMHYGTLNAGSTANLNSAGVLFDQAGNYVTYLLVKDGTNGNPYTTPIGNTAGDNSLEQNCLNNPASYGCPSACKDTCCKGIGYKFTIEDNSPTEYIGSATLTASQSSGSHFSTDV